jgi:inositol transporter-like SP family MFS transporter
LGILAATGAPTSRGFLIGSTQFFWSVGLTGTYALGFAVSGLGPSGVRLMVWHLILAGAFTAVLRLTDNARLAPPAPARGAGPVLSRALTGIPMLPLLLTGIFFVSWQLAASTLGTFGTYYLVTHTALTQTQATATVLFTVPPVLMAIAFTRLADTVWRDRLFVVAAVLQVLALTTGAVTGGRLVASMIVLLLLWSVSNVFGGEAVYRVWSHLLLPPDTRATAFGISYGVARLASAAFLLVVPVLIERHPAGLLWVLAAFLTLSGATGLVVTHHPRLVPALRNGPTR